MSNYQTVMPFDPKKAVFTPADVSADTLAEVKHMRDSKDRGQPLYLPEICDYFAPRLPGKLTVVIAQTSNYKTSFLDWDIMQTAKHLQAQKRDEIIVKVSCEESIEEQGISMLSWETGIDAGDIARGEVQDWGRLERAAIKIGVIPVYRIGHSLARAEMMDSLTVTNMVKSIKFLTNDLLGRKLKIGALYFDYLQAFPFDREIATGSIKNARRLQVKRDIDMLFQAAAMFKCPVTVAVQAREKLSGAPGDNMRLPGVYDGKETTDIATRPDRVITLWMPKTTHRVGASIQHGNLDFTVEENMLWLKVAKQRGRLPAGKSWPLYIDYKTNEITLADIQSHSLNGHSERKLYAGYQSD